MNNFNPSDNLNVKENVAALLNYCINYVKKDEAMIPLASELETLLPKLNDLEVIKQSAFVLSDPLAVSKKNDKIIIALGPEQKVDYQKHLLVELFTSVMKSPSKALNKGLSAIVINNIIGTDEEDLSLIDEEIGVNLLSHCYGIDKIMEYAINGNLDLNINDQKNLKNVLGLMEHNYQFRKTSKRSNLAGIQKILIKDFVAKDDISKEQLENFETSLFSDPNMFANPQAVAKIKYEYPGLENVGKLFKVLSKNINQTTEKVK